MIVDIAINNPPTIIRVHPPTTQNRIHDIQLTGLSFVSSIRILFSAKILMLAQYPVFLAQPVRVSVSARCLGLEELWDMAQMKRIVRTRPVKLKIANNTI